MKGSIRRFSLLQRIEHACVMVLFTVLAVTGLAQEFWEASWARWTILAIGGIDRVRWIHRCSGVLFTLLLVEHLAVAVFVAIRRRTQLSIVPTRQDFRDAVSMLRYYLRLSEKQPQFGRYDYRQKFEYWGLVLGGTLMVVTGFLLLYPVATTRFLPGEFIPAAKLAHGYEGLMAFLVVITWHIFNAHFSPDVFPFDSSIFTGKISRERMEREHPRELARLSESAEQQSPEKNTGRGEGAGLSPASEPKKQV